MNLVDVIKPASIPAEQFGAFMLETYGSPVTGPAENNGVDIFVHWDLDIMSPAPTEPQMEVAWVPWNLEYERNKSRESLDQDELALYANGFPENVGGTNYVWFTTINALLLMRALIERTIGAGTNINNYLINADTAKFDLLVRTKAETEIHFGLIEDYLIAELAIIDDKRKQAADANNVGQLP